MKAKICTNSATLKNNPVAYVDLVSTDLLDTLPKFEESVNVFPYLSFIGQQRIYTAYSAFDERTDTVYLLNDNETSYIFNKDVNSYVNNIKHKMFDLNSNLQNKYRHLRDDLLADDRAKYIIDKLTRYSREDMINDIKKCYNKCLNEIDNYNNKRVEWATKFDK